MSDRPVVEQALAEIDALIGFQRRAFATRHTYRELSLPQLHLLFNLQAGGPRTVSELAETLEVSTPSASAILDRMEEHDLVTRCRDTTDRRVVHVGIGKRGATLLEEMAGMKRDQLRRVLDLMTDGELANLISGVEALRRAVETVETSVGAT